MSVAYRKHVSLAIHEHSFCSVGQADLRLSVQSLAFQAGVSGGKNDHGEYRLTLTPVPADTDTACMYIS